MYFYPVFENSVHRIVQEASSKQDKTFMSSMDKSDIHQINATLVQELYKSVLQRNLVDFGDIPASQGDITKVKYYNTTINCIEQLKSLCNANGLPLSDIVEIEKCISNVKTLSPQFTKGFSAKNETMMIMYNSIVLAIVDCVSELIAEYMDYITNPTATSPVKLSGKFDKKRSLVCLDSIVEFNKQCKDSTMFNSLSFMLNEQKKNFTGVEVVVTGVIIAGLLSIIPITRELIFFYYNSRVKIADYLSIQADFLEMNKLAVEASKKPPSQKKDILKKQEKIMVGMRKTADKLAINQIDTQDVVKRQIKSENNLWSLDNIENQISKNKLDGNDIKFV